MSFSVKQWHFGQPRWVKDELQVEACLRIGGYKSTKWTAKHAAIETWLAQVNKSGWAVDETFRSVHSVH